MNAKHLWGLFLIVVVCAPVAAEDAVRNYGSTDLAPVVDAHPALSPTVVAFGHHRRRGCCGNGLSQATFDAYSTYQPYATGVSPLPGANAYNAGYYGAGYMGPPTPNPYGYYPNGQIWGSSGPTYTGPFPVWGSPSGVYDYRYRGWGSYGWGGWGGTGPGGWGYQGGFYW